MFTSPFGSEKKTPQIDPTADVIFVADMFVEDYVGGAELTTEALISSAGDLKVQKLHAQHVTMGLLQQGFEKFWVFGNFASLQPSLIPTVISNLDYAVLEYDYKFCHYRSVEKHAYETGSECDCHNQIHGKMISAFYHGSKSIWWMSEKQQQIYHSRFPFLDTNHSVVLSSVFDEEFFQTAATLKDAVPPEEWPMKTLMIIELIVLFVEA